MLGSGLGPALSRAAQEITEICSVDQTGCEDPDLDADTAAHTLHQLGQELRLTIQGTPPSWRGQLSSTYYMFFLINNELNTTSASETGSQAAACGALSSGSPDQHHFTRWVRPAHKRNLCVNPHMNLSDRTQRFIQARFLS